MNHDRVYDLVVAGGGPSGLAAAIRGITAGLDVLVVEPRTAPIDKACGEGLMPGAVDGLRALGVTPSGRAFHGIRYLGSGAVAEARFSHGSGLGVRRTALHEAMSARATELGVRIEQSHVRDIRQHSGIVEVDGRRARYLIAADGLHSPVRAALGLATDSRPGRARYGIRRHYTCEPWSDLVEVYWAAGHEVYVTPVAADTVGVAVLSDHQIDLDAALDDVPALREQLSRATAIGPARGAGPLRQSTRSRVAGRVLLVGDAAGYVDALTGEGIRLGLETAAAAVSAVVRDEPSAYEKEWALATAHYRHGTGALLAAAARPALRERLVPAAQRFPRLFGRCVDVLAGGRSGAPAVPEPPVYAER